MINNGIYEIKKIVYIFVMVLLFSACKHKAKKLRIAYSNDISSVIIREIEQEMNVELIINNYEYLDLGDC